MGPTGAVVVVVWCLIATIGTSHSHRLILIRTGNNNNNNHMVSHISHALPGHSSMTIFRTFPGTTHLNQSAGQSTTYRPSQSDLGFRQGQKSSLPADAVMANHVKSHPDLYMFSPLGSHNLPQPSFPTQEKISKLPLQQNTVPASPILPDASPLVSALPEKSIPGPFAPRYEVGKLEVPEEEARQQIREDFMASGLYPDPLFEIPTGLVNINYGFHGCIHLGTQLSPNQTRSPPTRVTFPADRSQYHTLLLVDADSDALHMLVVNIPGAKLRLGNTIAVYQPPSSRFSSGTHRYLMLALVQKAAILYGLEEYVASYCDWVNRDNFDLSNFVQQFQLELVGGNYFQVLDDFNFAEQQCSFTFI